MLTGGPTTRQDEFWPRNSTLPIPIIPQRPKQGSAHAWFGGVYNSGRYCYVSVLVCSNASNVVIEQIWPPGCDPATQPKQEALQ